MDGYLRRRLSDPRFAAYDARVPSSAAAPSRPAEQQWYSAPNAAAPALTAVANAPLVLPAGGKVVVANASKKGPCWTGYHKVEGKADYADGSCAKNGTSGKKKKRKRKSASTGKKAGASSSSSSSSSSDSDSGGRKKKAKASDSK